MSHLVIIDAHAILHRAYHSIPPLTHAGQPVNAIYGFYSMVLSAIDILKPTHLVVCLDSPGPTFRTTEFVGYRAKRKIPDHDLISQLPLLPQTLEISTIHHFSLGGYEADDLIASVVYKKKQFVKKITIITGDKDLMQLVDHRVNLFVPIHGLSQTKIYGIAEVKEKLGVLPAQVVDLKALMGDSSDNYPGVAGIGPKTAIDLLTKYQNLDNIYSHLANIGPTIKSKLETSRADAYLSRKLATLISNIPLKFRLKSARWNEAKIAGLEAIFKGYNFKSLLSRLRKAHSPKPTKLVQNSNQSSLF
jgi:DNA polymerase-1